MQRFNAAIRGTNAQSYLTSVLGEKKDTFVTSLVSVVAGNTNLQKCDPMSVVYTALKATALSLPVDPSLGYAAIIPYGTNASFQIMRNGWVDLLMRTGQVRFVANEPVHEGELVYKNKFTGEYVFDEEKRTSDKVIGYMAYVELLNGFRKTVYWTVEECKAHALKYSQTFKNGGGVWKDNFEAMALKTVLKHLIVKYCPKSPELQSAIKGDQEVTNQFNESSYADNDSPVDEQTGEVAESAKKKADEVKAKVAAVKERQSKPKVIVQEQDEAITKVVKSEPVDGGDEFEKLPF